MFNCCDGLEPYLFTVNNFFALGETSRRHDIRAHLDFAHTARKIIGDERTEVENFVFPGRFVTYVQSSAVIL